MVQRACRAEGGGQEQDPDWPGSGSHGAPRKTVQGPCCASPVLPMPQSSSLDATLDAHWWAALSARFRVLCGDLLCFFALPMRVSSELYGFALCADPRDRHEEREGRERARGRFNHAHVVKGTGPAREHNSGRFWAQVVILGVLDIYSVVLSDGYR